MDKSRSLIDALRSKALDLRFHRLQIVDVVIPVHQVMLLIGVDLERLPIPGSQYSDRLLRQIHFDRSMRISFDGSGFGDDGSIWGGEFFAGSVAGCCAKVPRFVKKISANARIVLLVLFFKSSSLSLCMQYSCDWY